jgi:hypothetical protein
MSVPPTAVIVYAGVWNSTTEYFQYYGVVSPIDNGFYVYTGDVPIVGGNDPSDQLDPIWVLIQNGGGGGGDITGVIAGTGLSGGGTIGTVTLNNTGILSLVEGDNIEITGSATDPTISAIVTIPELVQTLNGLNNEVTLTSPDASITITPSGQDIQLVANFPPANPVVESLNNVTGAVVLLEDGNISIVPNEGNHTVTLSVPFGVDSLNGLQNTLSLTSPDASITITPNSGPGTIELVANFPPVQPAVNALNTLTGDVTLGSDDGSVTIGLLPGNFVDLAVNFPPAPAQPFDTEGLQNKVGIFPVTPATTTTLLASAQTPPTQYVPDGTVPTSSTTPEGTPCWLYTKPPALTGFNYYPYNPRFSIPSAPLPYRKANTGTRLKTLWALIQPVVNIYTSGTIALNVYTYDDANPPTSGFYNTRWAYSNTAGAVAGTSGVNLFANYTYLVYAYDAPRTTNILGVGQPDNQLWGLRDPYDIYTGVHHIPLQNVVVAFNPTATPATNYITWNSTTAFTVGQTVVYSGTSVNPNGLFYTCILNNTNQPPVSATGVANTTYWTAISPQPSAYASAPILAININGISGSTGTWVAGNMLRVLSMGYSVGPSPTSTTASYEYVLN